MPEITDEELAKLKADAEKAKILESSKARLEEENSKIKSRAKEAEEKLSAAETKKLEEEGKTNELLAKEREARKKLEETLNSRTKGVMDEKLRAEVAKFAKDAHDTDMLLRVKEHKDLLKLDEENLSITGVEDFVKKTRETHPFLFGSKKLDEDYSNTRHDKKEEDDDHKDDEQRYLEEIQKVTTRKEYVAIRKKYGKPVDSFMGNV